MNYQPNFNQMPQNNKKRYMGVMFFVILAIGLIYGYGQFGLGSNNINITNTDPTLWQKVANLFTISNEKEITIDDDPDYSIPEEEKSRQDILILGIRGEDVEDADETGAMLTDTIMVLSFDKITKKTALISIPRDLYVRIYGAKKEKINSAYEVGALRKNGLGFTKKLISRITGVYIDNVIVLDFSSFRQVIDDLGGVDINLDVPFTENQQWGYEFNLPAGLNHLDGQSALYYVRSRFSSSDFDRAQRQQNLMLAIKEKVFELNILTEPIRTLNILNTIRNNIDTDLAIWDAGGLLDIAQQFNGAEEKVKRYVITTENLVYETHIQTEVGNLYALLPIGDNLQGIKQLFQSILE